MELETLYEDADLIAVNKPAGMLVESALGNELSLLDRLSKALGRKVVSYHRLDRDTSGVVLFGKTARLNREMGLLFAEKRIRKEYWALVEGEWPKGLNRVESRIGPLGNGRWANQDDGGKPALTTFRRLGGFEGVSWIQALPKTGRTHQIRLHCLKAGFPILGDRVYGEEGEFLALHARRICFRHPKLGKDVAIEARLPDCWDGAMRNLSEGARDAGLDR